MARRTFFSFHYQEDVWRCWNVRNCLVVSKDQEAQGFFDGSRNNDKQLGVKGTNPLDQVGLYLANGKILFAEVKGGKWVRYEDYTLAIPAADLWFDAPTSDTVVPLSKHCMRYDFAARQGQHRWLDRNGGRPGWPLEMHS